MKNYMVIESPTIKGLISIVEAYLNKGWKCVGGIVVDGKNYLQTVTLA